MYMNYPLRCKAGEGGSLGETLKDSMGLLLDL